MSNLTPEYINLKPINSNVTINESFEDVFMYNYNKLFNQYNLKLYSETYGSVSDYPNKSEILINDFIGYGTEIREVFNEDVRLILHAKNGNIKSVCELDMSWKGMKCDYVFRALLNNLMTKCVSFKVNNEPYDTFNHYIHQGIIDDIKASKYKSATLEVEFIGILKPFKFTISEHCNSNYGIMLHTFNKQFNTDNHV